MKPTATLSAFSDSERMAFQTLGFRPFTVKWNGMVLSLWMALGVSGLAQTVVESKGDQAKADVNRPKFQSQIRLLLAKNCWSCHGPDEKTREAELRLDRRDAAIAVRDGQQSIVPGASQESLIVKRMKATGDERMPPPQHGNALTQEQIQMIEAWIDAGAEYEPHWSFQLPRSPTIPTIRSHEHSLRNPIDAFLAEKQLEKGGRSSGDADRSTWIRRVYLDLIGMAPSAEEVKAFLEDERPDAWDRVVDDLLARPAYGERWARSWLDLARYADTNGYEKDRPRTIWPYRDWVIRALNEDMPYDDFSIRQLAGDMLPNATQEDRIATGFHRNTMLNEEGGIDPLEFRFYAMADRVATTGLTWLGLTTGCAQCHSHKFDPISHREYYEWMALFNNADEPDLMVVDPSFERARTNWKTALDALEGSFADEWEKVASSTTSKDGNTERSGNFQEKMDTWLTRLRSQLCEWQILRPSQWKTNSPRLELLDDGSLFSTGDITKRDVFEIQFPTDIGRPITGLRLEVMADPRLPAQGPGRCFYEGRRGDFFLSEVAVFDGDRKLDIKQASHSYGKNGLGSGSAEAKNVIDGEGSTGWSTASREGEDHQLVLELSEPCQSQGPLRIEMVFERHYAASLGRFRWWATHSSGPMQAQDIPTQTEMAMKKESQSWTQEERKQIQRAFVRLDAEMAPLRKKWESLKKSLDDPPATLVMEERPRDNPRPTFRHHRGEYLSPREVVHPGIPEIFQSLTIDRPKNRLDAARWLVSRENPLAARVAINRMWQAFFGQGIVRSRGDFGVQTPQPIHRDLLDWLVVDWMDAGWSMKKLSRTMALSAAYRRDSTVVDAIASIDPENHYYFRYSRQRMDAEAIRDSMLVQSGLMTRVVGGPSVRPPQPESVTALAYGKEAWKANTDQNRFRRSLYTYAKRTAPFAAFAVFDGPSGELCTVERERSNTPLQALTLLNDSMMMELAESMGIDVMLGYGSDSDRIQELAFRCWSRAATNEEVALLSQYVQTQFQRLRSEKLSPEASYPQAWKRLVNVEEPAAWSWMLVTRAMMNTDEAVTKP
ncbi:MAG: PSD1 and planctomycete cytochrome C domain-containing protein [Pirellulales bacterium]